MPEHILKVLKKCNGKISGAGGAAEILEVLPTTLHSKIKKLGILKKGYLNFDFNSLGDNIAAVFSGLE